MKINSFLWMGKILIVESLIDIVSYFLVLIHLEMDTTILSDQDLLNNLNLPDMDRMDIEESSFLKNNSFFTIPPPR